MDEKTPVPGPSGIGKNKTKPTKTIQTPTDEPSKTNSKKTVLDFVCEAIEIVGVNRKGASAQAIKKYILSNTNFEEPKINVLVNKALAKGIEKGILSRPPANKDTIGANGHFILAKKAAKPKNTKPAAKKTVENNTSDSETTKKPIKQTKSEPKSKPSTLKVEKTKPPTLKVEKSKPAAASRDRKGTKKAINEENDDRKDASDTEIVVKKKGRKSLKSYASDTEVDFVQNEENITKRNNTKPKAEKSEPPPKTSKAKGTKKLYSEAKVEKDKAKRTGKTKT